jgi:hypothetical protein
VRLNNARKVSMELRGDARIAFPQRLKPPDFAVVYVRAKQAAGKVAIEVIGRKDE